MVKNNLINAVISQPIKFKFKRDCSVRYVQSTAVLHNTFKTTTPFIDATDETLPLGDYRSLPFFICVKFSSVRDSSLKSTKISIIKWIKIRAVSVSGPHVKLDKVDALFFR